MLDALRDHYQSRQDLMMNFDKDHSFKVMQQVVEHEKRINNVLEVAKGMAALYSSRPIPQSVHQVWDSIKRYSDSLVWSKYPINITVTDDLNISRTQLMKFHKRTKNQTHHTSEHPRCKMLYAQYHQACRNCALALKIPLLYSTSGESHEFKSGDLSIIFYLFKKILTTSDDSHVCQVAEVIIDETLALLKCIESRMYHNIQCISPLFEESHTQLHKVGDDAHFRFSVFACFEVLSLLETVDTIAVRNCKGTPLLVKLRELCKLYQSVFRNCETSVRHQLKMPKEDSEFANYIDMIKSSVLYAELMKDKVQSTTGLQTIVRLIEDTIQDIRLLHFNTIDVGEFVYKFNERTAYVKTYGLDHTLFDKPISWKFKYKYLYDPHMNMEQPYKDNLLAYLLQLERSLYKRVEQLRHKNRYIDMNQLHRDQARQHENFQNTDKYDIPYFGELEQSFKYMQTPSYTQSADQMKTQILEKFNLPKLLRLLEEAKTEVQQSELHLTNKYMFNRRSIDAVNQLLKFIPNGVERPEDTKTYISYDDPDNPQTVQYSQKFNFILWNFLADRFSPLGVKANFEYDFEDHVQQVTKLLDRKSIRACDRVLPVKREDHKDPGDDDDKFGRSREKRLYHLR